MLPAIFTFNWIELVAVPLAISLMEAQPIVLILLFAELLFTGRSDTLPLGESDIVCLLLGSYWWVIFVIQVGPSRQRRILTPLLSLLGLLMILALLVAAHISLIANTSAFALCILLVTLLWLRRMYRGQSDLRKDTLISSFKINLAILLILLVCVATGLAPQPSVLLNTLALALPLFFLSSFLAFSLLRLAQVRREHRSFLHNRMSSNPTGQWTVTLVILWGALAALLFLFQTFLFPPLAWLFIPLGNAAYAIFAWLINFLLSLLHPQGVVIVRKKLPVIRKQPKIPVITPRYTVILILCVLLAVLLLALIVYWLYRAHEDAERRRSLPGKRSQRRKQLHEEAALEELDPMSARSHYRCFLRDVAKGEETLGRRPHETPIEYQGRLLPSLQPDMHEQHHDVPSDPAILDELTGAYMLERYAGEQADSRQRLYLHTWVPYLVQHLVGSNLTQSMRRWFRRMPER